VMHRRKRRGSRRVPLSAMPPRAMPPRAMRRGMASRRHCWTGQVQTGPMRRRVDAACKAGNNYEARFAEAMEQRNAVTERLPPG